MSNQVKPRRLLSTPNVVSLRVQLMAAEHKDRVGRRIKKARLDRKWSQRELAERLPGKVDGPSVSRWERGITYPEQYLSHLAQVFEVDVAYFLVEEAKAGTPNLMGALKNGDSDEPGVTGQLDEVLARLASLDEQVRLLRAELATADAEALKRTEVVLRAIQDSR